MTLCYRSTSPSWQNPDWIAFSDEFLWKRGNDVDRIIHLGRLPVILLAAGLGLLVFRFAREVAGPAAGLAAVLAFVLDPNMAAHSRLATTDLGVTALTFAAVYAWWRMARNPRAGWVIAAGVTLGLALVSKFTAALWVPVLVVTVLLMPIDRRRAWRWLAPALALAALTAWAVYGFELRPTTAFGLGVSVPMASYWEEALWQATLLSEKSFYLLGEISHAGWWYYFPFALLVKTPIPLLIGAAVGVAVWARTRATRRRDLLLVAPPAVYFAATLISSLNIGYRHLLPILPHLYVLVGLAVAWAWRARSGRWRALLPRVAVAGFGWLALSALSIYPHHLSYFNELAGGPGNGANLLVDSNLDWGQDLIRLADVVRAEGLNPLHLSYLGTSKAAYYGIEEIDLPPKPAPGWRPLIPEPGWYAISVSNLTGTTVPQNPDAFDFFRRREPDARRLQLQPLPRARRARHGRGLRGPHTGARSRDGARLVRRPRGAGGGVRLHAQPAPAHRPRPDVVPVARRAGRGRARPAGAGRRDAPVYRAAPAGPGIRAVPLPARRRRVARRRMARRRRAGGDLRRGRDPARLQRRGGHRAGERDSRLHRLARRSAAGAAGAAVDLPAPDRARRLHSGDRRRPGRAGGGVARRRRDRAGAPVECARPPAGRLATARRPVPPRRGPGAAAHRRGPGRCDARARYAHFTVRRA
ncbi:MAG: glycosyltransferase family 39 protein [Anaerolineae bacterium]|nr:glycosyltransferase family 39 protein [Anaerolineae bacterium]